LSLSQGAGADEEFLLWLSGGEGEIPDERLALVGGRGEVPLIGGAWRSAGLGGGVGFVVELDGIGMACVDGRGVEVVRGRN
jgi:hypothetical protein